MPAPYGSFQDHTEADAWGASKSQRCALRRARPLSPWPRGSAPDEALITARLLESSTRHHPPRIALRVRAARAATRTAVGVRCLVSRRPNRRRCSDFFARQPHVSGGRLLSQCIAEPQTLRIDIWYGSPARSRGEFPSQLLGNAKPKQNAYCDQAGSPDASATVYPHTRSVTDLCSKRTPQPAGGRDRSRHSAVRHRKPLEAHSELPRDIPFFFQIELTNLVVFKEGHDVGETCRLPFANFVMKPITRARTTDYC